MQTVYEDSNWEIEKSSENELTITYKFGSPRPMVKITGGMHDGIVLACPHGSRLSLKYVFAVGEV